MAKGDERHSKAGDAPPVARTPEEIAAVEARNALRQFDRLREMIQEAVRSGGFRIRPSTLMELNRLAIENLHPNAGAYRTTPITIGGSRHTPPEWQRVPALVDDMCDYVNERGSAPALHLAAYMMWRLNWIHPFYDGNGRTTRAASYLTLCSRLGYEVPGTRTIPEIIAGDKHPYYDALDKADQHSSQGRIDVAAMEGVLEQALQQQLGSVLDDARAQRQRHTLRAAVLPGVRPTAGPPSARLVRQTLWSGQPRWVRLAAKVIAAAALVVGVAWQLLINWDNPRVQQVLYWLASRFEDPKNLRPDGSAAPLESDQSPE